MDRFPGKQPGKPRFFYGWVITGISFTSLQIRFGVLNTFAVFLVALAKHFGWNRGAVSAAQSIVMVMIGLGAPIAGYCIQRWGIRKVVSISALMLGIVIALNSQIKQIWHFYLLWGLLSGMGHSFQSMLPWTALLSNWFIKKRGLAIGIAMAGVGLGYFVIVPLSQYLISIFGWQNAFLILGAFLSLGITPLSALFIRERPEDLGLLPDGENKRSVTVQQKNNQGSVILDEGEWTISRALTTSHFWFLCLSFAAILFTVNIILAHQVAFLVDVGYEASMAAFIFGIVGLTSIPSRVIWGFLSDRFGPLLTYTMATLFLLGGIAALLSIRNPSQLWLAYLFAGLFGFSYGTTFITVAVISANFYQGKSFSLIFGFITFVAQILGAPGAWVAGVLFDIKGNYDLALILSLLMAVVSGGLLWVTYGVKKHEEALRA